MDDLIEFQRARLDEDEQVARECAAAPWSAAITGMIHVDPHAIAENHHALGRLGFVASVEREHDRQHIARMSVPCPEPSELWWWPLPADGDLVPDHPPQLLGYCILVDGDDPLYLPPAKEDE